MREFRIGPRAARVSHRLARPVAIHTGAVSDANRDGRHGPAPGRAADLRYVALGDSYTIGTGGSSADAWPEQLVHRLRGGDAPLALVANLGVNGYTSSDVIRAELPALHALEPEFVTLLIGVNDIVQGVDEARYRANLDTILGDLAGRLETPQIVVVSTPDYTVTPAGRDYGDPATRAGQIRAFNGILAALSRERGIAYVDIHGISRQARDEPELVAADGLHPSAAQYGRWVDEIAPVVARNLAG